MDPIFGVQRGRDYYTGLDKRDLGLLGFGFWGASGVSGCGIVRAQFRFLGFSAWHDAGRVQAMLCNAIKREIKSSAHAYLQNPKGFNGNSVGAW